MSRVRNDVKLPRVLAERELVYKRFQNIVLQLQATVCALALIQLDDGQATPDSLTTSGAATPFNYQNDPRSNQLSPNTSMSHSMNGLDLNSMSRSQAAAKDDCRRCHKER